MNMQNMIKQAQKMQKEMTDKKNTVDNMIFEDDSELVYVKMNGKKEILEVKIKASNDIYAEDKELIEDAIQVALNRTFKKIDSELEKSLGQFSSQLNGLI